MKFKIKHLEIKNKILKYTILTLFVTFIIIAISNFYTQLVDHKQFVKMLLDKITFKPQLYPVAQDIATNASRQSKGYNKSLGSSLNRSHEAMKNNSSEGLLYRKRRYLQFPEGSSLQLVFNILLPIIDYTNYAILGITCALAFELPSKPLSELEDELVNKLHSVSDGLSQIDSTFDQKHIDKHIDRIKDKLHDVIHIHPSEYLYQNNRNYIPRDKYIPSYSQKKPIYYTNNQYSHHYPHYPKNSKFDDGNPYREFWKPNYNLSPYIRRHDQVPKPKDHAVYHIMGRRSTHEDEPEETSTWLSKLDQIHLQYHRSSRHEFYSKLEAMLNRQGKNGTECVLRALCETGNRRHETEPGELLTEIFRAVFTLPRDSEINYNHYHPIHKMRDDAHWNSQNCSEAYPLCENFIWDDNFII